MAIEFLLTPNNIKVFARRQGGKTPIKQGNNFSFDGDDPIDFEDADSTLHFFFPKDYARAVNDSATGFANQPSVRRYFYSDRGKDYMLVGVPWDWIDTAPVGDLIIDPTTSVATSEDVWLENTSNFDQNSAGLLIGKAANPYPKKRTIIKFNIAGSGIPSSATVLSAQMKLYYYSANNGGSGSWVDRWVQAHQILVSWNEAQATSVNRLSSTPWNVAYVGLNDIDAKSSYESTVFFQSGQTGTWKAWNLTNLTQKWVNGTATNNGVVLWATNETTNGYDLRFHSSDAQPPNANPPVLEVIYSTDAATKTVYFLKDHLGSIRATVLDSATAPVRGYDDFDPWGYPLALRTKKTPYDSLQKIAKNKFTGKEWDDEYGVNWNYLGARYYDSQIGRFPSVDRFADKYPSLTPYQYAANNPLKFIDINGDSLWIAGDKESALKILQQIGGVDPSLITVGDNGLVTFNTEGLDLSQNEGANLLNDIISAKENILFEIASTALGIRSSDSQLRTVNLEQVQNKLGDIQGIANFSKTQREQGLVWLRPKDDRYAGQVTSVCPEIPVFENKLRWIKW